MVSWIQVSPRCQSSALGAFARTPFVLVVDQVDNIDDFDEMSRDYAGIAESTGARTVIQLRQRLDVA